MNREIDVAYLAGLIDGEGCITIAKAGNSYYAKLQIAMTSKGVLDWVVQEFGGNISQTRTASGNFEDMFQWALTDRKKLFFLLEAIQPHLKVKKVSCLLTKEFCFEFAEPQRYSNEQKEEQEKYLQVVRAANSRGPGSNEVKVRLLKAVS